ncbi:MAG: MCE family protein [Desulfobacterium sp.]|nr:MCE family protein [Desulfobacterium sp.]MBU3947822.1 MCE family protein [Pseudomonadota bacterium]MBU4036230.1 MCE family protein [Pseudomonadota bacterium]
MATIKTKLSVGLFVIIGLIVAFFAIIWIGMSHYFEQGSLYSAYFNDSVQGLSKDSPVKFRGVTIGRVSEIAVAPDGKLIEVVLKIESDMKLDKDIIAQLKSVGITGIMFVELDLKKNGESKLSPAFSFAPNHTVIDTKPSEITRFLDSISDAIAQINKVDFEGLSDKTKFTLDKINSAVSQAKIAKFSSDIRTSLDKWNRAMDSVEDAAGSFKTFTLNSDDTVSNLNNTVTKIDAIITGNKDSVAQAIKNFNNVVENAGFLVREGSELVRSTDQNLSSIQQQILVTMQSIEKTSETLNRSVDQISDQPSLLLFSAPQPEKEMEKD